MPRSARSKRSFGVGWISGASSTRTRGAAMTASWTSGTRSTSAFVMGGTSSRGRRAGRTSTGSRPSGALRKPDSRGSAGYAATPSSSISKRVSSGLTIGRKTCILCVWTYSGDTLSTSHEPYHFMETQVVSSSENPKHTGRKYEAKAIRAHW